MKRVLAGIAVATLMVAACGGDDDDSGGGGSTEQSDDGSGSESGGDGEVTLVPLSTLDLDLPFEVAWDVPVPSDSTVADLGEVAGQPNMALNSEIAPEVVTAEYDEWFPANFEFTQIDSDFRSYQGTATTDDGSVALSALVSTCSDCPDYSTRVTLAVFES